MIAQGFGFISGFLKERNNSAYFRLKNYLVNSKNKRGPAILVRIAGSPGGKRCCVSLTFGAGR